MDYKLILAKDFCNKIFDGTHDSPKYCKDGYKLITSKFINNNRINMADAPMINETDYNKINQRSEVELGDILISMIGTVGLVCRINSNPNFTIKNIGVFRPNNELDSKYLYYYLQSSSFKSHLKSKLSGSTQQYITLEHLRNFEFQIPYLEVDKQHIVDIVR